MINKDWRPANWQLIKHGILNETPVIFSPSVGYSKDQKDTIMEKTASLLIKELLDAGLVRSGESESGKDRPSDESAWSGWGTDSTSQPSESEPN